MKKEVEEKITIGSEAGGKVNCSMCKKEGTSDEFVTLQDSKNKTIHLCPACKEKTNEEFANETKSPNWLGAVLMGAVAAAVGGAIWYFVAVKTGKEIGYLAVGLGYLIGFGVHLGSGKKRGHTLQILSAVLALVSMIVAEKFIFDYLLNEYVQSNLADFPGLEPGQTISVSFLEPEFWKNLVSPVGLLIYAIGVYLAYTVCKPRSIA